MGVTAKNSTERRAFARVAKLNTGAGPIVNDGRDAQTHAHTIIQEDSPVLRIYSRRGSKSGSEDRLTLDQEIQQHVHSRRIFHSGETTSPRGRRQYVINAVIAAGKLERRADPCNRSGRTL